MDASNTLANFIRVTIRIRSANLLTKISNAKFIWKTIGINAAHRFAEGTITLEVLRTLLVCDTLHVLPGATNDSCRVGSKSFVTDT